MRHARTAAARPSSGSRPPATVPAVLDTRSGFRPAGESTMITVRHAAACARGRRRLASEGGADGMEPRARDLVGAAVLVAVLVALIVLLVVAALPS